MQNLSQVASLVLEIWRYKISVSRREPVIKFGYLLPKNGFLCPESFLSTQHWPPGQFQQFPTRGKFFIFKMSKRKTQQQQSPWLNNFARIPPDLIGLTIPAILSYSLEKSAKGFVIVLVYYLYPSRKLSFLAKIVFYCHEWLKLSLIQSFNHTI